MVDKKNNKRIIKRIFALFMTGAVIVSSPLGIKSQKAVKAATTEYVKEVVLSYGKTEEDAAKWLKDKGYKVVDGDLHKGTDATKKKVNAVLMGYKTTTNPNDAITDISVMPMNGGFKITDMESILKNQQEEVENLADEVIIKAREYKANYKKAVKAKATGKTDYVEALKIHDALNKFVDDDTKKGMGDFFLTDFSKENNCNKLMTILIQANPRYMSAMQNILTMAAGNMNNTWIKRMVEANKDKSFFDRMVVQNKTKARAKKFLDQTYGEKLDFIASDWENLQKRLFNTEDITKKISDKYGDGDISEAEFNEFFGLDGEVKEINEDMSETKMIEAFDNNIEIQNNVISFNDYSETLSLMSFLSEEKMNGESLLEYIMKDRDFDTGADRYEVCALLEFLSDAQLDAVGEAVDTYTLIKYAITGDNDIWKEADNKRIKEVDKQIKSVEKESIYTGVNREVFEGEVAVTSLADTRDINCTYGTSTLAVVLSGLGSLIGICGTIFGASLVYVAVRNLMNGADINFAGGIIDGVVSGIARRLSKTYAGMSIVDLLKAANEKMDIDFLYNEVSQEQRMVNNVKAWSNKIALALGVVIAVAAIIISFFAIKNIIDEIKEGKKGDYSVAIPQFMVDVYADEDDNEDMVYYEAVRCNRNDPNMTGVKESNEGLGDYGDLNGDSGKCWAVPYTTKDQLAGDPILADTFEVKHGDVAYNENVKSLHSFNERNTSFNITSMVYNYNDKEDGTYLSYKTDKNAFNKTNAVNAANNKDAGSVLDLNNKKSVVTLFIGLATGLVIAGFIALVTKKKKEEN
ncbi:MAG: hypothetical protein K6D02_10085 [Lachnospiraceae bacterium]|nr:hypothetical protein [Lachnospiraceae bacterium]